MGRQSGYEWIPAPAEGFDVAKFAARYGLSQDSVESVTLSGDTYAKVPVEALERIGDHPEFEIPVPIVPMTRADYGAILIQMVMPTASIQQQADFIDVLLKFTGDRAPDFKPVNEEQAAVFTLVSGSPTEQ